MDLIDCLKFIFQLSFSSLGKVIGTNLHCVYCCGCDLYSHVHNINIQIAYTNTLSHSKDYMLYTI